MKHRNKRTKPYAGLAAVALCIASHAGYAAAINEIQSFAIPAQALAEALRNFSQASGLQLLYDDQLVAGKVSPALNGSYTPRLGLDRLLAESGLGYQIKNGNLIVLEQNQMPVRKTDVQTRQSPTALPAVNVVGKAIYDATDPYNPDYVLPNATAGTKTDTPIMETPLNVQVVSKQVMKDQQVITLDQALKNVSGITTNTNGSGNISFGGTNQSIFLRGFESETFFRNGFRLQQGATTRQMANVESVEVLKGAAAILYGQVEPGGMVNVITKQPLSTPYYALNQQFGSYDLYRTTLDATGPITKDDTLLYRMNMSYQNSGSFREFVGKDDVFLAPVLKWNISPRTQATLELEYNHQHLGLDTGFVPLFNDTIFKTPRNRNYGGYSSSTTETIYGGFNWSHQFNDDWSIKHRFSVNQQNIDQPHFVFPQETDGVDVSRQLNSFSTQNNTYSTNVDLTGHFDTFGLRHTLLLGGDYYRIDSVFANSVSDPDRSNINLLNPVHPGTAFTQPLFPMVLNTNRTDQYGLYIQDQIKLPYNFHVMGGIRYQNFHQNHLADFPSFDFNLPSVQSNDAVTPRVGILWQPKSWLSLYANYVESFGVNTAFTFTPDNKPVPPTEGQQYEGGIKTEFFDGRLRATLAYYDLTKTNVPTSDLSHPGFSVLTGAVRSRGPELDITGEILPGWNVIATYANTDARIIKTVETGYQALGTRFWNVPRNTGSLWSTYELKDGDLQGFKFGGGVTVRDGQTACCSFPAFTLPGYATVGLLAAYSVDVGNAKITAQLNVDNLLDKQYVSGLFTNYFVPGGFNAGYADFGQPRTFVGSINIQY
ncbi:TonB-dependent siderophore receptor [Methylomonas albis]|uniref:TonB-dependent receptor n=1 Tax=Methylomonas albis TaxID=1854563 RepID=A0ABR9CY73_9GAMM|nr:TonB-dependent receptor [Methylomonas albis]MBD9355829.1 TonB-dependent receptor [Methylomonas albis]